MRKVRSAIIGGGFIGKQHVEAVRRLGFVEVVAVADTTLDRARSFAADLFLERAYGDYAELLAAPDIEVIHNCTPNQLHYAINRTALEAGKHIISEKPLAMTSAETASLLQIAQHHNRLAAVNFNHRGYPMIQQARALVANGSLGKVQLLHGAYLQDWLLYATDWNWRLDPAVGGASRAVADIGSHWADLVQHVTGQRITRVFADLATVLPFRKRPLVAAQTFGSSPQDEESEEVAITTEDYATVIFATDHGARGTFTVSQVSAGHKNNLTFEINGTGASVRWDGDAPNELWFGQRDKPNALLTKDPSAVAPSVQPFTHLPGGHPEAWPDALKNVMGQMYNAALEGRTAPTTADAFAGFADGHRAALLVDAVLTSAQRQAWVDVAAL